MAQSIVRRLRAPVLRWAGVALASSVMGQTPPPVRVGPNEWVSAERGQAVHVEPVIAASPQDPTRLVAATMVVRAPHEDTWQDSQGVAVYSSRDAGRSWHQRPLPGLPQSWMSGDPWLTWSDEDVVYLSCLVTESLLQGKPLAVWVFSSQDGGWTWTEPVKQVFPADTDQDHPVIASGHDEQGAAIVYAFGTAASRDIEGVDVAVSRSPSAPFRSRGTYAPDRQMVNLGSGAVLPGGGPVFTYFTMRQPYRLWSVRGSEETGAWTETLLSRRVLPVGFPMLAVDQGRGAYAGRVYSVWVESEDQRDLRVVLSWSGDGGVTWSKPLAVHQDTSRVQRTITVCCSEPRRGGCGLLAGLAPRQST